MPLESISAKELERTMREWLGALQRLDKKCRPEANELIDRLRGCLKQIRPDLFQPVPTPPASSGSERDVTE